MESKNGHFNFQPSHFQVPLFLRVFCIFLLYSLLQNAKRKTLKPGFSSCLMTFRWPATGVSHLGTPKHRLSQLASIRQSHLSSSNPDIAVISYCHRFRLTLGTFGILFCQANLGGQYSCISLRPRQVSGWLLGTSSSRRRWQRLSTLFEAELMLSSEASNHSHPRCLQQTAY